MTTTPHTLEELVQLLEDGHKYYFSSEELNKLGLAEIVKHRLESWGMPAVPQMPPPPLPQMPPPPPLPTYPPTNDPVDMIKVEPPSEAEMALVEIGAMISDAAEDLQNAEPAPGRASWYIEHHIGRAQAQAQIAQAQASYAIALQLRRLADLLEEALPAISRNIDQISNELEVLNERGIDHVDSDVLSER